MAYKPKTETTIVEFPDEMRYQTAVRNRINIKIRKYEALGEDIQKDLAMYEEKFGEKL